MAFPVLKILSTLIVFLFFCGSQVDGKVEKYVFNIVENGTSFKEEVEVDVDDQTEVIRVPQHNNVDAVEVMNDFKAGFSVRRDPVRRVCYVSGLDSSFPSPGKMKFDMDQASKQSSVPDKVTTKSAEWKVVGFADRSALPQKILTFCGTFPIYEIKIEEIPPDTFNTSQSGRVRTKRQTGIEFKLCANYEHTTLENCLKKVGHRDSTKLQHNCILGKIYCFYIVKCFYYGRTGTGYNYQCHEVDHLYNYVDICCTPSC